MLLKVISTGSQAGNSYALIADNGEILLLDCGVKYWSENRSERTIVSAIHYRPRNVVGCLVTHGHHDHLGTSSNHKDFIELIRKGIKIYTNDELQSDIETIYGEKVYGIPEKIPVKLSGYTITPFYLPHDNTPNFGYLIDLPCDAGRLLYATDFEYLPYTFKSMKINYFLLECNHQADLVDRSEAKYEHSRRGHSELETVKEIIRVNKTPDMRNVILCHLSDGWSDPETMQREIQSVAGKWVNVEVACAGMELELSKYPF